MAVEASRPILTTSSTSSAEETQRTDAPSSPASGTADLAPLSPNTEQTELQENLGLLHQIEWTALALGLVVAVGSWLITVPLSARIAVLVGAIFSSINFRLLIWSWSWIFQSPHPQQVAARQARSRIAPRFLIKYLFLLAGLGLLIGGLQLHVLGFMIGMGNVLVAVALSPVMMQTSRS